MNQPTTNPLLTRDAHLPFDTVRAEHVGPAMDALLEASRAAVQAILEVEGQRTWANTMFALDLATEPLEDAYGVVNHLRAVAYTDALAEAHAEVTPRVVGWFTSLSLNSELFAAVTAYAHTDEAAQLTGERRRYLDKTLDEFKRQGADLPADQKQRFEAVSTELSTLANTFSANVLKSTSAWSLTLTEPSRLAGLPDAVVEQLRESASSAGSEGWRVTLSSPIVLGVLRYADDAALREEIWQAYYHRANQPPTDNNPVILRMLELRHQLAELLGYPHFADYVLHDRMAQQATRAQHFVDDLTTRARPSFEREREQLAAFRRSLDGRSELGPADVAYYAEKLRQASCEFDEESLRPYFPVPRVLAGLFELTRRLFQIEVRPTDTLPTWHTDVQTYTVHDTSGRELGAFYVDLFPREDKRDGAWMVPLRTGSRGSRGHSPHLGAISANFTPPAAGRPALLTHREVETIFHEFGHLLHHLLSDVETRALAGTSVAWDFVELPSQIMENWCWQRAALALFSGHVDTGEPLPDDLFDGLTRSRRFRRASALMRQLGFAHADLALHLGPPPRTDIVAWARELMEPFAPTPQPESYAMFASFGHLFGGATAYAAGYYSYLWAAVLDADAFTRFERDGLFDADAGAAFRAHILSQGATAEPGELYARFMGRPPSDEAMLRREGLLPDAA